MRSHDEDRHAQLHRACADGHGDPSHPGLLRSFPRPLRPLRPRRGLRHGRRHRQARARPLDDAGRCAAAERRVPAPLGPVRGSVPVFPARPPFGMVAYGGVATPAAPVRLGIPLGLAILRRPSPAEAAAALSGRDRWSATADATREWRAGRDAAASTGCGRLGLAMGAGDSAEIVDGGAARPTEARVLTTDHVSRRAFGRRGRIVRPVSAAVRGGRPRPANGRVDRRGRRGISGNAAREGGRYRGPGAARSEPSPATLWRARLPPGPTPGTPAALGRRRLPLQGCYPTASALRKTCAEKSARLSASRLAAPWTAAVLDREGDRSARRKPPARLRLARGRSASRVPRPSEPDVDSDAEI
ncbi:MAG: hypothetical protein AVDCRST_MAG19-4302 [uncultured Thermomicrobiales bacterium]|uniref:Uncharacterized protein n=1 Tax=uncultured Thermomicrobiales bacterium TaxID=1645740 RepID=A0A6J4VTW4_9BACT|nr:MAG: hypothetical protein AVDCRST_MAG19-4302 [uncultured Thermomicrobiales bacterium]